MFLLVPAHPGCPGQIPESRKMVVCVCVCNIREKWDLKMEVLGAMLTFQLLGLT